jgi:hypothetical protein
LFELEEVRQLLAECGATVVGLHAHVGSGILTPANWQEVGSELVVVDFPTSLSGSGWRARCSGKMGQRHRGGGRCRNCGSVHAPRPEIWQTGRYLVSEAGSPWQPSRRPGKARCSTWA